MSRDRTPPELVYAYTNKSNAIAVVSDGTRVLGLGDIAVHGLARCAEERGIDEDNIICTMDEWEPVPRVAVATAFKAQEQGLAGLLRTRDELHDMAVRKIREAQSAMQVLMKEGVIAAAPNRPAWK